ncbi:hypothetical protein M5K25_012151 [Dendrobium thyrsiflorum]|uniref:Uncharacterized protein n=1 Tax=Dendrobium thyrsiflorum TaxID=117978 RepID=A0ABD0UW43_DENTH
MFADNFFHPSIQNILALMVFCFLVVEFLSLLRIFFKVLERTRTTMWLSVQVAFLCTNSLPASKILGVVEEKKGDLDGIMRGNWKIPHCPEANRKAPRHPVYNGY